MARLMTIFMALWVSLMPSAVGAEVVVAGLSQEAISITTNFDGSEILIFGAVRRDAPPPGADPMQVIITVEGPARPVTVRRKERRFGIWINVDAAEIDQAPTYYAVSTTAALDDVLTQTADLGQRVSIPSMIRAVDLNVANQDDFIDALMRIRLNDGTFQLNEGDVRFREQTLFDTSVRLPANLVEGDYRARIILTRSGEIVDVFEQMIPVRKVGLERMIYTLAHEQPLAYGILSLTIAIIAGWLASAVFRYIQF